MVGPETAWPGGESRSKKDIRDGPSNTILLVEMAESGIPWMKPEDLNFDRMTFQVNEGSRKGPGSKVSGARALLATGRVLELPDHFSPTTLRAMLTIDGGESVEAEPQSSGAKVIDDPPASVAMRWWVSSTGGPTMEIEFELDTPIKKIKSCQPGSRLQISAWTAVKLILVLSCAFGLLACARSCGRGRARGSPAVAMHL